MKQNKVYVWTICGRMVHWLIAISFVISFLLSHFEYYLNYHIAFGFIYAIMILYRIQWGFWGSRYSKFSNFKLSFKDLCDYFEEKKRTRYKGITAGHNPASSWYTIITLISGLIVVISGTLLYSIQESKGVLSFFNEDFYMYSDIIYNIHYYTTYFLIGLIVLHISGLLIDQFYHKNDMMLSMINGYKNTKGEDVQECKFLNPITYISLSYILIVIYALSVEDNIFLKNRHGEMDYKKEQAVFNQKCSACHEIYSPHLLPKASWERIMNNLEKKTGVNHFTKLITDQNISKEQRVSIKEYLIQNSAENSKKEEAVKITKLDGKGRPRAITKTRYWRQTHKNIPFYVYYHPDIKDKSNCWNCHQDAQKGVFDDNKITFRLSNYPQPKQK